MGRRGMNPNKKYIKWAVIAFCVWYVINRPDAAGATVGEILDSLGHAANSLSTFVDSATS